MISRRIIAAGAGLVAALGIAACGSGSSSSGGSGSGGGSATVNGAGSTFAAPIYEQWGSTLKDDGVTLNYNAVGSGAGVAALQAATAAFAGDDAPLKPTEAKAMKGPVLQFPVAFGSITVSYSLSGVNSGIKLDGPTLANIYLGKVKSWNDPSIKALNPGMSLPGTAITVVHRSDSSGTTDGFTKFLTAVSPSWSSQVGHGKDVKWPAGTGAAKNAGVAAAVKQTDGAIGYVEQAYAVENNFTYAAVKNKSGTYVLPTLQATSAAAEGIPVPADLGISTINSSNPQAYPIASQTFIDVYADPCKNGGLSSSTAGGLKKFLTYAFGPGQQTLGSGGNQLPYAPLPSSLQSKVSAQLTKLSCNGSPVS